MILTRPQLLIDTSIVTKNICRLADKTRKREIAFTPHFKTHQSREIGKIFRDFGVSSIKVSSLSMANYFMEEGWKSITLAFPSHPGMLDAIKRLAKRCEFTIFVNNEHMARALKQHIAEPLSFYVEIDTGSGRSGVHWKDTQTINAILEVCKGNKRINFEGFYTHTGDSYQSKNTAEIQSYHDRTERALRSLYDQYKPRYNQLKICSGDTPTASVVDDFGVINQISAGNFVYYDVMQALMGACGVSDIAVALAVPIAEIDRQRNNVIVHGGAVHLSKDAVEHPKYGLIYGLPVPLRKNKEGKTSGWGDPLSGSYVSAISQEHGSIYMADEFLGSLQPGDPVGILPVHSCLTANLMKRNDPACNPQSLKR